MDLAQKTWANLSPAPHLQSGFNIKMQHKPARVMEQEKLVRDGTFGVARGPHEQV